MNLALLSAAYMLGLMTSEVCPSEVREVPGRNETIAYKCVLPHKKAKDQSRIPPTVQVAEAPPPVKKKSYRQKKKRRR
jgi:hypothetical protein